MAKVSIDIRLINRHVARRINEYRMGREVMPALKCVGGLFDGEHHEIGNLKVGDLFQIAERHPVLAGDGFLTGPDVAAKFHEYTVRQFMFPGQQMFRFLAPKAWSDWQAIDWQFNK